MSTQQTIGTAAGYRSRRGQAVPLPGGEVWLLRRVNIQSLIESGSIPDTLAPMVEEMIQRIVPEGEISAERQQEINQEMQERLQAKMSKMEELKLLVDLYNRFVCAAAIQPRVTMSRDEADANPDTYIHVSEVDLEDKQAIFIWTQGGEEAITASKSDGEEPSGDVAAAPEGEGVRSSSVRPIRSRS